MLFRPLPAPNASQVVSLRMRTPQKTLGYFEESASLLLVKRRILPLSKPDISAFRSATSLSLAASRLRFK